MYLLQNLPQRITDSNGAVCPGALMDVYLTGTSTRASLYADQAGTIPLTNPVVANVSGVFPQVWVDGATEYTVTIKKSDGTALSGMSWNDLSGLGYDATIRSQLADTSTGGTLIGWLRAAASGVATTVKRWMGWQEISAFEFMSTAQIADYQASTKTLDLSAPLQAWINACAASAASGGKLVGRLPPGNGRVDTTLTVPTGVVLRGHGVNSQLSGWGVGVFDIQGDFVTIEEMALFGYTNAGSADPRTQDAISSTGTLAGKRNFANLCRLYLQGWNRGVNLSYVDYSVVDDIDTVNCNYGIRYHAQCVNNTLTNSRLVVNGGTASIITEKAGADSGEGLMVSNCLLASGAHAFRSDAFLAVGFHNCVADLLSDYGFHCTQVGNFYFSGPWVYSAKRCFHFANPGAAFDLDANINVGLATTTGAGEVVLSMEANNVGLVLGGTYKLTSATGSVPIALSGSSVVVGPVRVSNATTNSDVQVNGANIRISQEALLPNGIQTVVSQVRSVASGATTTLPNPTGAQVELINVTGNTGCTTLNDATAWIGKMVVLRFTGTPTWTDGGNLLLNGNFVATADDTLSLVSNGTAWVEVARSAN